MAMELLGEVIDIHSGGEDNIFPHHECEIAQSCAATGCKTFANYWFHTRFLLVDGGKMSKSKGNFYTLRDLVDKGSTPAAIRLELIRTHYRSNANFTLQGLKESQRQVDRWRRLAKWLCKYTDKQIDGDGPLQSVVNDFKSAMCDDLNVAGAIGILSEAVSKYAVDTEPTSCCGCNTLGDEYNALLEMDSVLGVLNLCDTASTESVDVIKIDGLINKRLSARENKDWSRADEIRDELLAIGIAIKDSPEGTTWTRIIQ
jgi:cysteinyl-tRNA synthetase